MEEPEADKDDFLEHLRGNLCPWMEIFFFLHLGLELKSFPFEPDKQIKTSGDLTSR